MVLIIGSDSLASMPRWHRPSELLDQVTLAVVQRGGDDELDFSVLDELIDSTKIDACRDSVIRMPVIEISSSEIRERAGQGRAVRHRVPRAVEAFIDASGVYAPAG